MADSRNDIERADVRTRISQLREESGNACAECGEESPEWSSVNIGIFLCIKCAGLHRVLSVQRSRVRSVRLDTWNEDMVETLAEQGNRRAKKRWEANVPACWIPPTPLSRHVCREQWIRAKYERQEFVLEADDTKRPYITGLRQGYLYKKKRQSEDYNSRWFVLSHDFLTYFKTHTDRTALGSIPLLSLNVTLNGPGLDDYTNSMLLVYRDDKERAARNIFVYSDDGQDIMYWYLAIRQARIKLLQEMYPERSLERIREVASTDFAMTGYMCKTPPRGGRWQKRLFVLDRNSLRYYSNPKDATPLGEVILGPPSSGYWVDDDVPERLKHCLHVFMLHVPHRANGGFPLLTDDASSKKAWVLAVQEAIQKYRASPEFFAAPGLYETDESGTLPSGDFDVDATDGDGDRPTTRI